MLKHAYVPVIFPEAGGGSWGTGQAGLSSQMVTKQEGNGEHSRTCCLKSGVKAPNFSSYKQAASGGRLRQNLSILESSFLLPRLCGDSGGIIRGL